MKEIATTPKPGSPPDNAESRVFHIELRAAPPPASDSDAPAVQSRTVVGYAAKFNSDSEDMGFIEVIEPGAFREAIPKSDIRALFNHDPNHVLARSTSGTLKVEEDAIGLRYEFDLPETTTGNDLLIMLQRGDVSQSSFGFTVKDQAWETKKLENGEFQRTRRIKAVERLYDVSPVTYPAYADTAVAMRSMPPILNSQLSIPTDTHRQRLLEAIERTKF